MENNDKVEFARELTLTIQCLSGTIHPPKAMLRAFYEALKDLQLDAVVKALRAMRKDQTGWASPKNIRVMIEGNPDRDEFFNYMDNYVSRHQAGAYDHPIGRQVIQAMGGTSIFRLSTNYDRKDLQFRWLRTWREIASRGNDEPGSNASASEGNNGVHGRRAPT